jgi:ubiquinone/menaquinone biosynthesis C-methylase UbiE
MSAAYDNYDYPLYWKSREYEHASEIVAIKALLSRVSKFNKIIDIGAGYGRLVPAYIYRAKKVVLSDPSAKLLSIARKKHSKARNISYIHSSLENLKVYKNSFDMAIMVRVLHHIRDLDRAFDVIDKILVKNGYFILEFPNKNHLKAMFRNFMDGNLTYPISIWPIDISSKKSKKLKSLPFINYHPDQIIEKLKAHEFEIIEIRSVSNIRSSLLKRLFPVKILIDIEKYIQRYLSAIKVGPSIFILARKRG